MTDMAIQEKVLTLHENLKRKLEVTPGPRTGSSLPLPESFTASRGWLDRFTRRYNLHTIQKTRETASGNKEVAAAYLPTLKQIISDGGCTPQQVFNAEETGLFCTCMPSRTIISKEEKSAPGHKVSKERLSLLLGGNAAGDLKLKPLLIIILRTPGHL